MAEAILLEELYKNFADIIGYKRLAVIIKLFTDYLYLLLVSCTYQKFSSCNYAYVENGCVKL